MSQQICGPREDVLAEEEKGCQIQVGLTINCDEFPRFSKTRMLDVTPYGVWGTMMINVTTGPISTLRLTDKQKRAVVADRVLTDNAKGEMQRVN